MMLGQSFMYIQFAALRSCLWKVFRDHSLVHLCL